MPAKKILITGASGFIGSFLVEEGLRRGYEVYAGVRKNSSRKFLKDPRIRFFDLDFSDAESVEKNIREFVKVNEGFDYIIHGAGITKAKTRAEYFKVNSLFSKTFIDLLLETQAVKKKFILISSLAAYGPGNPKTIQPIRLSDPPNPITSYGKSKLEAEQYLASMKNFPHLILRPTAVYGPREKDIYLFFKMLNNNIEAYIGFQKQHLSFIYVKDLVKAIYLGMESSLSQGGYFIGDGNSYDSRSLGNLIKKHLGKKTIRFSVPSGLVRTYTILSAPFLGASALNTEKILELESKNWLCDTKPIERDLGFKADYDLDRGVEETTAWYKQEGWL